MRMGIGGAWLADHTLRSVGAGVALFDDNAQLVEIDGRAAELLNLADAPRFEGGLDHPRWSAIHLDSTPISDESNPVRTVLGTPDKSVADVIGVLDERGETRWLAVTALPVSAPDGIKSGVLASFVEVTGVVRDRAAVDRAERLGRASFDHSRSSMCVVDATGLIVDWNRAFAAAIDRPDYEILHTSIGRWIDGLPASMGESDIRELGSHASLRWADGVDVVIRAWPYEAAFAGRWMLEISPAHW